jgi:hypothetical protein
LGSIKRDHLLTSKGIITKYSLFVEYPVNYSLIIGNPLRIVYWEFTTSCKEKGKIRGNNVEIYWW